MKKFLLLLIVPFLIFSQGEYKLGSYTKERKNNINFEFKKPLKPFEKSQESYSVQGNANLVTAYSANIYTDPIMLQIYSSIIPKQFRDINWKDIINSKSQSEQFIEIFLTGGKKLGWNIYDYEVKEINGTLFLEIRSSITIQGVTQKQINWMSVYNDNLINILGATLKNSFDENVRFIKRFAYSVKLNKF